MKEKFLYLILLVLFCKALPVAAQQVAPCLGNGMQSSPEYCPPGCNSASVESDDPQASDPNTGNHNWAYQQLYLNCAPASNPNEASCQPISYARLTANTPNCGVCPDPNCANPNCGNYVPGGTGCGGCSSAISMNTAQFAFGHTPLFQNGR